MTRLARTTPLPCLLATAAVALMSLAPGQAAAQDAAADTESILVEGQTAPRLQNLGNHKHPVTTSSPRAQLFFNQGLTLAYAFNHYEAGRSFQEAARLDPECAMCYWGEAFVLGPNINASMRAEDEHKAYELAQKAVSLKGNATPRERAYIDALTHRYSNEEKPDRAKLNRDFAEAMAEVHKRFPDDTDAATIYAEAMMNLRPWNYWTPDGLPYAETAIFVPLLESIMRRDPHNPGANHLYIHAAEATKPQLAEGAADRLRDLVPAAGHLQHMPGHIYVRIGRYADASLANVKAIAADEDYITQCRAQGLYPLEYYPHNIHFLWLSSTWEGRSKVALEAARKVSENGAQHVHELSPAGQIFPVISLYANARFGKWEEILKEKQPPSDHKYWLGMWHYARGLAFARTKRFREADGESKKLSALAADRSLEEVVIGGNSMGRLLRMASLVLAGEMEAERGKFKEAVAQLQDAILLEDSLNYIEPPDWHYPIRQSLGAVLLKAGRPLEAETVYWEDLRRNPDNGWSLFGLMQSLRAQGKEEQAAGVEARFKKAWANADVTLTASRF